MKNAACQTGGFRPRNLAAVAAVRSFIPVIEIRAIAIITIANSEAGS
jgi:hypothetical protein